MDNQNPPPLSVAPIPVDPSGQKNPELFPLSALIEGIAEEAGRRHDLRAQGKNFGPVTPFPELTKQWGGSIPRGLHIVLGKSGVGKTAFALQIAALCECPCLYITCEMTPAELLCRTTARVTRTLLQTLKDGTFSSTGVRQLATQAATACPQLTIANSTQTDRWASPKWMLEIGTTLKKQPTDDVLIIVDSLHSWAESAGIDAQDYELISFACRELRTLAEKLNCPVIAISEMNRASVAKGASKEKQSSGAGSRKIEYGSESVIYLDKGDYDKLTHETEINLIWEKNRNGAAGKQINLIFEGGFQRYREA